MQEIEVKILEIDTKKVIAKLKELGARKVFEGQMDVCYYDFKDHSLSDNGKILRLRTKGQKSEFTVKRKMGKAEAKVMEEYEVTVNDFAAMQTILQEIGLKKLQSATKHRASYALGKIHFEFDTIPGLPTFLEVEAPTMDELKSVIKKIGFTMGDTKPWSGKDVVRHYGKRKMPKLAGNFYKQ